MNLNQARCCGLIITNLKRYEYIWPLLEPFFIPLYFMFSVVTTKIPDLKSE